MKSIQWIILAILITLVSSCLGQSDSDDIASTNDWQRQYHDASTKGLITDDITVAETAVTELRELREQGAPIQDCGIRHTQAQIVARFGQRERALDLLEHCEGPAFDYYRAVLLLKTGSHEEARKALSELVQTDVTTPDVREAEFQVMLLILLDEDPTDYIDRMRSSLDDEAIGRLRSLASTDKEVIVRSVWP